MLITEVNKISCEKLLYSTKKYNWKGAFSVFKDLN